MVKPWFEWQEAWFTMTKPFFIAALVKTLVSWWFPSAKMGSQAHLQMDHFTPVVGPGRRSSSNPSVLHQPQIFHSFPRSMAWFPNKRTVRMPAAPSLQDLWLRASWPEGSWRCWNRNYWDSQVQQPPNRCRTVFPAWNCVWWCLLLCSTSFAGVQCFFLFGVYYIIVIYAICTLYDHHEVDRIWKFLRYSDFTDDLCENPWLIYFRMIVNTSYDIHDCCTWLYNVI